MPFAENVLLVVQIKYPYSDIALLVNLEGSLTQQKMNAKNVQKERSQVPIKLFVLARRITTFSFITVSYHTLFELFQMGSF